jgi:hypothetical protein
MESDKNIFPEINLGLPDPIERIKKIAHFVFDRFYYSPDIPNTGGAPMLDRELYDKPNQMELF